MTRQPTIRPADDRLAQSLTAYTFTTFSSFKGSLPMYSMHEALARDRMRESQQRSAEARLVRSLSAQRRWHRVAVRARAASERHEQRAGQVAVAR